MDIFIKSSNDYKPVGRHYLTQATAPANVCQEPTERSFIISKRGTVPDCIHAKTFEIPTFQIASCPRVDKSDAHLLATRVNNAYDTVYQSEDAEFFKTLDAAGSNPDNNVVAKTLTQVPMAIWDAIARVQEHNLHVVGMFMHTYVFDALMAMQCPFVKLSTSSNRYYWSGDQGYVRSINIHNLTTCPKNKIYAVAKAETLGVFVIEQDAHDIDISESRQVPKEIINPDTIGRVVSETIGICISNSNAIGTVTIERHRMEY